MGGVTVPGLLSPDDIQRLRDALIGANYTSEGIAERLGPDITGAVARNDFRAALKATSGVTGRTPDGNEAADSARRVADGPEPLDTLIRLYICGQTESEEAARSALGNLKDPGELLIRTPDGMKAGIDLEPYGQGKWILADLPGATKPLRKDHVLGVGGASTTLTNATVRRHVNKALDLGTGCGVQALSLADHADHITATDLSERALRFAGTAAQLAGQHWDLRQGDMIEPVKGERFDLVVSNPPFVVGPGTTTHTYRDSGRPGDAISAELARASNSLLNEGGTLQFLANWLHITGENWADRVAGWFAGTGMDVWVIQREVSDPMSYVDLWLTDAGERDDPHRAAAWLDWFDAHKVEAVGFGLIVAQNNQHQDPLVRVETLRQPLTQPFGPQIEQWFQRQDWLRQQTIDQLLDHRYRVAPGVTLHQEAARIDDEWDVTQQVLVQAEGLGWSEEVDPVLLSIVGGCDGDRTLRELVALLAAAYDEPVTTMNAMAAVLIPHMVEHGYLEI